MAALIVGVYYIEMYLGASRPVIVEHISLSTEASARQWLFAMMNSTDKPDLTKMLVTLWAVWHARRKAIHEEIFQSPMATTTFVESYLRELDMVPQPKPAGAKINNQTGVVRWIPPPPGLCKINVDGAVAKTSTKGAVSAVCRSDLGAYLGSSAIVFKGLDN
jgi:hypothetical protein